MCGIFAALSGGNFNDAFETLQHRGPDRSKIYHDDTCFMGFHRLCIHDTSSHGDQPFEMDDLKLICNGEIYNYKALVDENNFTMSSDSDCEIILHMYKKYGIYKTLRKLDGVFSFVLKDGNKLLFNKFFAFS